jgi:hypothetical protein
LLGAAGPGEPRGDKHGLGFTTSVHKSEKTVERRRSVDNLQQRPERAMAVGVGGDTGRAGPKRKAASAAAEGPVGAESRPSKGKSNQASKAPPKQKPKKRGVGAFWYSLAKVTGTSSSAVPKCLWSSRLLRSWGERQRPTRAPTGKEGKNRGPQPKHRFSSHVFALGLTFLFLFVFSPTSFCRLRLPFASIFLALG